MDPARPHLRPRARRRTFGALALVAALLLTAIACSKEEPVATAATTTSTTTTAKPTTTTTTTIPTTTTTRVPGIPVRPGWTLTARPKVPVPKYDGPHGQQTGTVDGLYYGNPTALPVFEQTDDGWLHVRTPYKPNNSTAWIQSGDNVELGWSPWKVELDLTTMRLKAFKEGEQILDAPVGIGTDVTPTPQGDFFVTHLQPPASAGYGPFVVVTSGHSEVLQSFGGFPDGIFALHGPIGSEYAIGDGAKISNGCIRMKLADQKVLTDILPGSPVRVFSSPPPPPEEPPVDPAGTLPTGTTTP